MKRERSEHLGGGGGARVMVRAVVQRCVSASVRVNAKEVSRIKRGLVCLVGLRRGDTREDAEWLAKKIVTARLFEGGDGSKPWAVGVAALGLDVLCVSQFTLHASMKGAKKPSFHNAMGGDEAKPLYELFLEILRREYDHAAGGGGGEGGSTITSTSSAATRTATDAAVCEGGGGGGGDVGTTQDDNEMKDDDAPNGGKRKTGAEAIADGVFGAMMAVELVNDGPVTLIFDSQDKG